MNKRRLYSLLLILAFAMSSLSTRASHIVGGDFSLVHLNGNAYELTLRVLRDCENGIPPLNEPLYVGMYDKATNRLVKTIKYDRYNSKDELVFTDKGCIRIPTGCTEMGVYSQSITLDPNVLTSQSGYYFSWERCCRNTVIKNIVVGAFPGVTGMAYYMEIPPLAILNSSPVFRRNPLTLLCVDNPFTFNYDCFDKDGDSLVYTLITPTQGTTSDKLPNDPEQTDYPMLNPGPYTPARWANGYSLDGNIMDALPALQINRDNGQLTVTPKRQGVYAIAIRVEEYRNGMKIGEVRRELQLTVSSCAQNPNPIINTEANNSTFNINIGDTLCFPIIANDQNGDSLDLKITGDMLKGGAKAIPPFYASVSEGVKGKGSAQTQFCWRVGCEYNKLLPDTYLLNINVKDNGCPINKIAVSTVKIIVNPMPLPEPPLVVCLDRIDDNTLKINLGGFKQDKYAIKYFLYRINPDKSEELKDSFLVTNIPKFFIDDKAFAHRTNHYRYYLFGVNKCGFKGKKSYEVNSDPDIPLPPNPSVFYRATVRDENRGVLLEWSRAEEDNYDRYIIQRKKNNVKDSFIEYKKMFNRDDTTFVDSSFDVNKATYCYRVLTANRCGYTSVPSNIGCNILLTGLSLPFEHQLNYSEYNGWKAGVSTYNILRSNPPETQFNVIGKNKSTFLDYSDDKLDINYGANWYKINAIENIGGYSKVSASNQVFLFQKPLLYPPNAFTPNGDQLNDSFFTSPIFVKDYHIKIFTRWGELVYESDDKLKHWNGKYRGGLSYINAFIWQVEYTGWDNSSHTRQGFVTSLK